MPVAQEMKVVLDINRFWDDELTGTQLAQDLGMNYKSISNLKKGTEKGDYKTLVKLSRYFSNRLGKKITIEDLLVIEE